MVLGKISRNSFVPSPGPLPSPLAPKIITQHSLPRDRLVSSVGRVPVCCAGDRGFEPQTAPTLRATQGLKITEQNVLPL